MKIIRCIGLAVLTAAVAAPGLQAQMQLDITPRLGATFFPSDLPSQFALSDGRVLTGGRFHRTLTLGVDAGVRLNPDLSVEAGFGWSPMHMLADSGLEEAANVNAWDYGVDAVYYLPRRRSARPFVGLGVGRTTYDYQLYGAASDSEWTGSLLAGLYLDMTDRSGVRFQIRDSTGRMTSGVDGVGNRWSNAVSATMGFSFRADIG